MSSVTITTPEAGVARIAIDRPDKRNAVDPETRGALIEAYGRVKARTAPAIHMVRERPVMTLESALDRVSNMLGVTLDWMELRDFLPPHAEPRLRKSALASSFVAALELARLGKAELQQDDTFGPLHLRRVPA